MAFLTNLERLSAERARKRPRKSEI
ncbi:hypothetical protein CL3_10870 [butyrate-producing bacterium SM4/1]|nr:hypothetical protein CL3_10870 [butyrate-producing bacterium SM4/1]